MDSSKNKQSDHLGVNKIGKNIRKSPIHQPNFTNDAKQQPQPQVYNISKNDFRHVVQQLTGSTSQEQPLPRSPQNPPKPQSMRLQKIRPPPLGPINRPNVPPPVPAPAAAPPVPHNDNFVRPGTFVQPSPTMMPQWMNIAAESPISAYVRYLQSSIIDPVQAQPPLQQPPPPQQPVGQGQSQPPTTSSGPGIPLSPTSQFLLQSPIGFGDFLSPKSSYPLLSPGAFQFSPALTPNFAFSPMAQQGILGSAPLPPPSPGLPFPWSPSSFFPIRSPRWGGQ